MNHDVDNPVELLLVEDNAGDVRLAREGLRECRMQSRLHVAKDGVEAMAFLRQQGEYADAPRPDLVILDLNLPRKDGREVLKEIKEEDTLKGIPVVILTTSKAEEDIYRSYDLGVNSFISKPVNFGGMTRVMQALGAYWFEIVELPPERGERNGKAGPPGAAG